MHAVLNIVNAQFNEQTPQSSHGGRTKTDLRQKEAVDGSYLSGMDVEHIMVQQQKETAETVWEPSVAETYLEQEEKTKKEQDTPKEDMDPCYNGDYSGDIYDDNLCFT